MEQFFGHSNDSLVVTVDNNIMFSGDTILAISTVTRFLGGSTERFWKEDIPKLKKSKVDSVVPGHGRAGKLEEMLAVNIKPENICEVCDEK